MQYSLSPKFTNATKERITGSGTTSRTFKNLKSGKTYYIRIQVSGKSKADGKYYYSAWSPIMKQNPVQQKQREADPFGNASLCFLFDRMSLRFPCKSKIFFQIYVLK